MYISKKKFLKCILLTLIYKFKVRQDCICTLWYVNYKNLHFCFQEMLFPDNEYMYVVSNKDSVYVSFATIFIHFFSPTC